MKMIWSKITNLEIEFAEYHEITESCVSHLAMTKPFEIHVDLQQLGQLFYKLHNIDSV